MRQELIEAELTEEGRRVGIGLLFKFLNLMVVVDKLCIRI
jgi:hypothetical protein